MTELRSCQSDHSIDAYASHERSTGAIVINKLFMRLLTLLYSISLDAYRPATL